MDKIDASCQVCLDDSVSCTSSTQEDHQGYTVLYSPLTIHQRTNNFVGDTICAEIAFQCALEPLAYDFASAFDMQMESFAILFIPFAIYVGFMSTLQRMQSKISRTQCKQKISLLAALELFSSWDKPTDTGEWSLITKINKI